MFIQNTALKTDTSALRRRSYGYPIDTGYVGYIDGRKMLFATESEYEDYLEEKENCNV